MNKLLYLFLLCCAAATGQNWKTISLNEDIKFDFPKTHQVKDSANFEIYSAEVPDAALVVTRTIEKTHVFSWNTTGILELYDDYRNHILAKYGGELISDEVVEFQKVKTARFTVKSSEDSFDHYRYYLVFYFKGHLYTFELRENSSKSAMGRDHKLFAEINIAGNKPQPVAEEEIPEINYIAKAAVFLPFVALFIILPAALVLIYVLWKRYREDKKKQQNKLQ